MFDISIRWHSTMASACVVLIQAAMAFMRFDEVAMCLLTSSNTGWSTCLMRCSSSLLMVVNILMYLAAMR